MPNRSKTYSGTRVSPQSSRSSPQATKMAALHILPSAPHFPCHSGATLSIRRLPSFVNAYFCCGELGDAPHEVDKPRAFIPVKEVRAAVYAAYQVIAPIWKIYPAPSHAEQYITDSR